MRQLRGLESDQYTQKTGDWFTHNIGASFPTIGDLVLLFLMILVVVIAMLSGLYFGARWAVFI